MSATPPVQPVDTGYLLKSGSPALKVKIWGVLPGSAKEFEAIIDTGFTGFLSMPLLEALPLGLVLATTAKVTLADGSTATKLLALGSASLPSGRTAGGLILLEPNPCDVLLGMDFLNKFERTLLLFGDRALPDPMQATAQPVLLVDNTTVREILETIRQAALEAAAAAAKQAAARGAPDDSLALPGPVPAAPSSSAVQPTEPPPN